VNALSAASRTAHLSHRRHPGSGRTLSDAVGEHEVAVLCAVSRSASARKRARTARRRRATAHAISVIEHGQTHPLNMERLTVDQGFLRRPWPRGRSRCDPADDAQDLYDGVPMDEVRKCAILAARSLTRKTRHTATSARLLLNSVRYESWAKSHPGAIIPLRRILSRFIKRGSTRDCWTSARAVRPALAGARWMPTTI